jgi:hypothetical protein
MEIGREYIERGVHLHVAKNSIVFDDPMQSKIVATVLGLVAEIECDFISSRTKEALAKGINKVSIAKLLDVSPNTLYEWLKVRRPGKDSAKI